MWIGDIVFITSFKKKILKCDFPLLGFYTFKKNYSALNNKISAIIVSKNLFFIENQEM